jgi:dTDP-4-dehydrorhamnose 3,5-epimerase
MRASTGDPIRSLGEGLGIRVRPRRDTGAAILAPGSSELIAGVQVVPGVVWPDDRGIFTELMRVGSAGPEPDFGETVQISAAYSYPGTIKAIHYHRRQSDLWAPLRGQFQMALFDLRLDSPTFGGVNTIFAGEWRPWRVRIPAGVGHGYKVLGMEPGIMVYATNRFYDSEDEGRIAYDDADLNYAWETQFR